ncbi:zf-HC2 domain-containing protein [Kitasatospora sp. NPDC096147]|uniref:zf-HC2 domain-containing protein n=1 Tax=Kitasatospora sp. NPDC096147 TaxID=3364093 RepID=UPI00381503F0
MSSAGATGRSRRGSVRAALGRRAEPLTELQSVPAAPEAAEQHHLGDRLAAFVDGELDHDARERVQAHLATCADCLAEADESRSAKLLLTRSAVPEPSGLLMARLLAVAAGPADDDLPGSGPGAPLAGPQTGELPGAPGPGGSVFGGSRLTGGSFGRGAGATFGGGALGADSPLAGVDPRARRATAVRPSPAAVVRPLAAAVRPLAALAELPPAVRPWAPRGRRFVFAAAGAFSVAAVTLGGVGAVSGQPVPTRITPVSGSGSGAGSGGAAVLPVDFQAGYAPGRGARPPAGPSGRPEESSSGPQHYFR